MPASVVVGELRRLLQAQLSHEVDTAFVYGSVATGSASAGSDVDSFVITRAAQTPARRAQIGQAVARLQIELGYLPDLAHPVEIFATDACVSALQEATLVDALDLAGRGEELDPATFDSDCLEIARALLHPRLVVTASPNLERLSRIAQHRFMLAAQQHDVSPPDLASRIGLKALRRLDTEE